jgi:hypothetical protein
MPNADIQTAPQSERLYLQAVRTRLAVKFHAMQRCLEAEDKQLRQSNRKLLKALRARRHSRLVQDANVQACHAHLLCRLFYKQSSAVSPAGRTTEAGISISATGVCEAEEAASVLALNHKPHKLVRTPSSKRTPTSRVQQPRVAREKGTCAERSTLQHSTCAHIKHISQSSLYAEASAQGADTS